MRQGSSGKTQTLELSPPERLTPDHEISLFDCGDRSINDYLQKRAMEAQRARHAVVYVACVKGTRRIAAYYTLSNASVARQYAASARLRRNAPDDLPVTVLGRMGVSLEAQGRGFAVALLADAVERALGAAEIVGSTALIVHPLDESLANFYARFGGFKPCPDLSPLTMMLSLR